MLRKYLLKKCQLCLCKSDLCNSHAIPDSIFRSLFKQGNGQAIELSSGEFIPNKKSQDSWSTDQLCSKCEEKLNITYDQYGLKLLRGKIGNVTRDKDGVHFSNINSLKFKSFILSIFWRGAVSDHDSYKKIQVTPYFLERIRFCLVRTANVSKNSCTVIVRRLVDTTEGGFNESNLRNIVVAPFPRQYEVRSEFYRSISMIFLGFYFEIFDKPIRSDNKESDFILGSNKTTYITPYLEITEIPEVFDLMVSCLRKEHKGLSSV